MLEAITNFARFLILTASVIIISTAFAMNAAYAEGVSGTTANIASQGQEMQPSRTSVINESGGVPTLPVPSLEQSLSDLQVDPEFLQLKANRPDTALRLIKTKLQIDQAKARQELRDQQVWTFWGSQDENRGNGSVAMPGLAKEICISFMRQTNRMNFDGLGHPYSRFTNTQGVGCFNTRTGEVISPGLGNTMTSYR
jgi:hypothetical protein